MMRFRNVAVPAGFDQKVQADRQRVADDIAAARKPDFKGRETWKNFKKDMAPATFGKCGYCEVDVWTVDRFKGDVEHYRPKGRVDTLTFNRDGTITSARRSDSGYHWLAYDWGNYILTCSTCNSAHKQNLFPLGVDPAVPPAEGDERNEQPLLLNPFGKRDPLKHLVFDRLGVIGPRRHSKFGRATIAVCGLSRTALEKKRRNTAEIVSAQLAVLGDGSTSGVAVDAALQTLSLMGRAHCEHAGMVRAMFTDATGLPWSYVTDRFPQTEPVFEP